MPEKSKKVIDVPISSTAHRIMEEESNTVGSLIRASVVYNQNTPVKKIPISLFREGLRQMEIQKQGTLSKLHKVKQKV